MRPAFGAPTAAPHPSPRPPAQQKLSTGQKVAIGTGLTIGGVAVTTLVASALLGMGVEATLKLAWKKVRQWV